MPEVALTNPLALEQIVARQGKGTQELVQALDQVRNADGPSQALILTQ